MLVLGIASGAVVLPALSVGCSSSSASSAPAQACGLQVWHKPATRDAHVEIVGDWNDWKRPGTIPEIRDDGWIAAMIDAHRNHPSIIAWLRS